MISLYIKYYCVHHDIIWCDQLRRQHINVCKSAMKLMVHNINVKERNTHLEGTHILLNCIIPVLLLFVSHC
jgi:hypothetical protein